MWQGIVYILSLNIVKHGQLSFTITLKAWLMYCIMFTQAQFYLLSSYAVELLSYLTRKDEPVDWKSKRRIDRNLSWSRFECHCDLYDNQEEYPPYSSF